jgi:glycosyltransferase involved in cell wall biosynthesis
MSPLITLITTFHNRERYLGKAIESVLAQTYPNFELLLWDDGSTDASLAIAQNYCKKDPRIQLFPNPHQGRALSLQAAHTQAKGAYLGWVDSDDLLAPNALAETVQILEQHPEIGLVYTNHLDIDATGDIKGLGQRCQIPYSPQRILIDFMTFHFRLFRREVFERAGGIDTSFPAAIDYDLCLRMCEITQVFHLAQPLYFYRVHRNSISGHQRLMQVYYASVAIQRAIERRGLAEEYELEVKIQSKFLLKRKNHPEP